jgi:deoxyribose-phosphate aldolase
MQEIKNLAINIFEIEQATPCKCGGAHEICLRCKPCRVNQPDQIISDPENVNLAQYIDHTVLKPETIKMDIKKLCREADDFKFKSVCINPCHVKIAKFHCNHALVCTVIGFPLGANTAETKLFEARKAIEQGANEIDMVINIGYLKSKDYMTVQDEIFQLGQLCKKYNVILKVIIETALLDHTEKITACLLAKKAGADFVKTSTGFSKHGATPEDVALMRTVVGNKMGVKASGGVKNKQDALDMIKAGANRIGTSNGIAIMEGNQGYDY